MDYKKLDELCEDDKNSFEENKAEGFALITPWFFTLVLLGVSIYLIRDAWETAGFSQVTLATIVDDGKFVKHGRLTYYSHRINFAGYEHPYDSKKKLLKGTSFYVCYSADNPDKFTENSNALSFKALLLAKGSIWAILVTLAMLLSAYYNTVQTIKRFSPPKIN